jgi:hypothetical protein
MPVRTRTIVEATCDDCQTEINTDLMYVDAGVYGVAFHPHCWTGVGGPQVTRLLGLDDIYYRRGEERLERAWK